MTIPVMTDQKVAIIGGGIAGLSAAWYLQQQDIPYVLYEASERFGGLLKTITYDGYKIEYGPDAVITRKPWAYDLAQEIGLGDQIIPVNDTPERIYILSDGQLAPLPDGLRLLVPTNMNAFLQSPIMSTAGKLRLLMDTVIAPRDDDADESLAHFVTRRMGHEALDKLADPLLAGVYNAEMDKQSILATFPQYRALEKKHGSLIRGMIEATQNTPAPDKPALISFKGGMGQLIDTLVSKLTGEMYRKMPVKAIAGRVGEFVLTLGNDDQVGVDSIILATPAHASARLLADVAPQAADGLRGIRYAGVGTMSLAFDHTDIPRDLDAYGIVIPSSAGRDIDGMQWSSSKWPYRAPSGKALIRAFFGGPHTRYMLDRSESELVAIVREELRQLLGITAKPHFCKLGTWRDAYPQYDVGHITRIDAIMHALPEGVKLAGNAYRGVGVPDTIKTAKHAAETIIKMIDLQE